MSRKRPPSKKPTAIAISALSVEIDAGAPRDFRIIPAGTFRSGDGSGRPKECGSWQLDDADGARLVAEMAARESACVIDYEHATLLAKKNGTKAIAAGWYEKLEWRPGDGLWVIGADWTAMAAQEIEGKQYRYVSPVFSYDPVTGRVLKLFHAALTNDPGIDGLTDLAALAAEVFLTNTSLEVPAMDELLEQLRWLLNLPVGATAEDIIAQLDKLKSQLTGGDATAAASFDLSAHLAQQGSKLAELTAQVDSPDPAKFVPVAVLTAVQGEKAELQTTVVDLQAEINGGKLEKIIADGKAAGKITPATEAWARNLGQTNLAALTSMLEVTAPTIVPNKTQTGINAPSPGPVAALSAEQQQVCELLGVPEADFKQTLSASA
ncbi:phage protease [Propionivibrio dicarboxylicus]|uniref:Mu-like prophage I protein n=1 Tax=Propionivibrio dicarboxylicus TaxID=83767 RepID=A0A1G8LDK9_9RHOO|nr:phage protease [Propionivibrio dicarboxylicus]SDI53567.1 Mu-like prophage I protein [Propionivibrio dicarboxylicus]